LSSSVVTRIARNAIESPKGRINSQKNEERTDRKEEILVLLHTKRLFFRMGEKRTHHSFIHSLSRGNDEEEQ
jgi:hypothetical protein